MKTLLQLLATFFQIGLFSIGGGYASLGLIEQQVVRHFQWLSHAEYLDLVTIAEMTPGPITLNAATFVGIKMGRELSGGSIWAGIGTAILTTLACVLPAVIIVLTLAYIYSKYKKMTLMQGILATLRPAVIAIIAAAALNILIQSLFGGVSPVQVVGGALHLSVNWPALALFALAFGFLRWKKPNPMVVIALCGLVGGALTLVM